MTYDTDSDAPTILRHCHWCCKPDPIQQYGCWFFCDNNCLTEYLEYCS